jgi:hypothetical protein
MTLVEYDEMLLTQGSRCALCHSDTKRLVVDHDHESGKVRSLLCDWCNHAVGIVEKDEGFLEDVRAYIERHRSEEQAQ